MKGGRGGNEELLEVEKEVEEGFVDGKAVRRVMDACDIVRRSWGGSLGRDEARISRREMGTSIWLVRTL